MSTSAATKDCHRCHARPRWHEGIWCATCVWEICCSRYPRLDDRGNLVSCVHGGRLGDVYDDMMADR